MALKHKDLPVSVCPLEDNEEGKRIQTLLRGLDSQYIRLYAPGAAELRKGLELSVEFRVDRHEFSLTTTVANATPEGEVTLYKPAVIHRRRLRDARRRPLQMRIYFTLWTETGRHDGEMQDISADGFRMISRKSFRRGALISLDFYIRSARIRVIGQGLVAWCRTMEDNEYLHECGIQFTTISNETRKKLERFVGDGPENAEIPETEA
ncbi:MAG: PilZ domain-containing protein [Leptospirales bacterium]|nr:PilZ domain-containing protein [Leptospirales bacterium]